MEEIMLKKVWSKLLAPSPSDILARILETKDNQDYFLGIKPPRIPDSKEITNDADKIIRHGKSQDYQVWAQEAWSRVIEACDKLMTPDLEPREADFYRGCLYQAIDLLKISSKAKSIKESIKNYQQQ